MWELVGLVSNGPQFSGGYSCPRNAGFRWESCRGMVIEFVFFGLILRKIVQAIAGNNWLRNYGWIKSRCLVARCQLNWNQEFVIQYITLTEITIEAVLCHSIGLYSMQIASEYMSSTIPRFSKVSIPSCAQERYSARGMTIEFSTSNQRSGRVDCSLFIILWSSLSLSMVSFLKKSSYESVWNNVFVVAIELA